MGQVEGFGESGDGGAETTTGPEATAGPFNCKADCISSDLLGSVSEDTAGRDPVGDGEETGPGGGLSLSCGRLLDVSMPLSLRA